MNTTKTIESSLAYICAALSLTVVAANAQDAGTPRKRSIRLTEIDGRSWLVTPEGRPFFAHGITHVTNRSLRTRYDAVSKACKDLGFNAYGYGCPSELKKDMPYLEGRNYVPISMYRGNGGGFRFIDVFDPREQRKLAARVEECCLQNRDNPNLIGYYWTDLAVWPLKNSVGKNWVDFIRELPADAPGRKAYAEHVNTWQGDDPRARDLGFLRVIAREYFRVMGEANRKHDPHHLVFGDRFAFNTIVPEVLEEMLPWVDAIAIQPPFQPGFPRAKFQEIHELAKKPILICDFAIRFKDGDKSIRGWKLQEDAGAAGVLYSEYVRAALETPYIIGAFWCNPVDLTPAFNKNGIKQGLFGDGLKPRPGLSEAVSELNRHIARATPDRTGRPEVSGVVPVPANVRPVKNEGTKPRNVVFILSDDHRYDAMSFMGHPFARTPHMDAMAKNGAHLKNAFVTTSLCSPSRASILTGLYTFRHRVIDNQRAVPKGTLYFPQYLQEAGYNTGFVGKWHMGSASDEPRPGFDYWFSFKGQGHYYPPNDAYTINENGKRVPQDGYITTLLTKKAVEFLERQKGEDEPFFLYLSHKAVHGPFTPEPK